MTYRIPMARPDLRMDCEERYVMATLAANQLTMGPVTQLFERKFAERLGVKHAIATSSGTAALHLALLAAGVKPGDRVLVPTLTYVATVAAVRYCGAVPVFGDSDPETWGLVQPSEGTLGATQYAIPVHLYGVPVPMKALTRVVIEDAAEALGATVPGPDRLNTPCGTLGKVGVFSFYGNKILTTGEGGMVVTDDDSLAEEVLLLRGQGMDPARRYWHTRVGYNYRMTDLHAAIGVGQLERLDEMLLARTKLVYRYLHNLSGSGLSYQVPRPGTTAAPWVFACLLPKYDRPKRQQDNTIPFDYPRQRDYVMARLAEHGIETRPTFPCVHQMPPYQEYAMERVRNGYERRTYPVAEDIAARGLLLPLYSTMTLSEVDEVCDRLRSLL